MHVLTRMILVKDLRQPCIPRLSDYCVEYSNNEEIIDIEFEKKKVFRFDKGSKNQRLIGKILL